MGIPSYFSYIVKNHGEIIKRLNKLKSINNFYLDSNSIIYDVLRDISDQYNGNDLEFENILIHNVIKKLDSYIFFIKPTNNVYIAFDGVAPVAKLEQQRTRRYKSYLMTHITNKIKSDASNSNKQQMHVWDKTAITPGTDFMKKLGHQITNHYESNQKKYNVKKIIVSSSNIEGEGEHKIFEFIRKSAKYHSKTTTLIYGLDADLIMLCLNHLHISKNIYLYRETPEFIKSIDSNLEPNKPYYLDIPVLSKTIIRKMLGKHKISTKEEHNTLYDYIFLCFMLGNDFLPHFPSLNIRTTGIFTLLAAYNNTLAKKRLNLSDGEKINWHNFRILTEYLANQEHDNIKNEYKLRNKLENRFYKSETIEDKLRKLDNIPTKMRQIEKNIDPFSHWWEIRYYKNLFDMDINKAYKQQISINYLEGLEWVLKYYTTGCVDWRWHYRYHYPPLLKDLLEFIPSWDTVMINKNDNQPVSDIIQLSYVLPRRSLKLIPHNIESVLLDKFNDKYPTNCELQWAFCKYLWEAHPKLPSINIEILEKTIKL